MQHFDPEGRVEQINQGELVITQTGRHLIGLAFIYFQTFAALGLAFGLIFFLLPDVLDSLDLNDSSAEGIAILAASAVALLTLFFMVLVTKIYLTNKIIITKDNVTHVTQIGLFHKKVSEISMANVEDVTAHRKGILATIFNYGRLHIETAGEQNNYDFLYCPNPSAYAKAIQDARLEFIKTHGD